MCCVFTILLFLGPRVANITWWILSPARWTGEALGAFNGPIVPILGIIFLPWTLLFYMIVFPGGVVGIDWLWIVLGAVADVASYAGGGWRRRDLSYYPESMP